ncbi:ATP-dependent sacrificial sulfur transferase LarE [Lyngbya confervoides]|uniref:ATP-dependent sacrificial sulfur transferase LarE n=1 Tax=Lyngbya confervoides BDU141951 TaxID=1574623 RepID=A0ABD4T6N2_9CYAN|nr:ATP-dependent sacrificial sulfur transferase LarE [Lyngbya confervoides]MCM1984158.1 ATP-dependent sacrificial sulfur transferase LarE [Lyngbya confervoides BDU141951]
MLSSQLQQLRSVLRELDRALIAYSGGVDSALVAKVAYDVLGDRALAVTAESPSLPAEDLEAAKVQAQHIGIAHRIVQTHELENPSYSTNPVNRCYFCKSELYDTLKPLGLDWGYPYVIDGVNADDLQDYRPGIQAAKERGTRSPLAEVGMTKLEVRALSQSLGLPWWNKPAQPCLSSRFPYGESITPEKLQQVAQAERYLKQRGYSILRVRSDGGTARIELPPQDIPHFLSTISRTELVATFKALGFLYVTLDLEGFRSGKLNQGLSP